MRKFLTLFFCLLISQALLAQNGSITGKVVDENGLPLPGANIVVLNTTIGAATDENGIYSISNVPVGTYSLRAQFVGYNPVLTENISIKPNKSIEVNFALSSGVILSDEIVVVGYGVQQKREVTGAATKINVDDIQKLPTTSIGNALQGAAAGVNVAHSSGAPGVAPQILIRGTGSLGGNDPLYIVDGFEVDDIGYLSPNDIKDIQILKDASSSAIYGARAANGVVSVTTKSGEIGKPVISYSGSGSYREISNTLDMLSPYEFVKLQMEINPDRFEHTYYRSGSDDDGVPYKYQSLERLVKA